MIPATLNAIIVRKSDTRAQVAPTNTSNGFVVHARVYMRENAHHIFQTLIQTEVVMVQQMEVLAVVLMQVALKLVVLVVVQIIFADVANGN